jgi:hypothetical protein
MVIVITISIIIFLILVLKLILFVISYREYKATKVEAKNDSKIEIT